jgi:hypothetical protein
MNFTLGTTPVSVSSIAPAIATVVAFACLALVALALGLLARAYSKTALATGLAGLLGLTAAVTWSALAGPVPAAPPPSDTTCKAAPWRPLELLPEHLLAKSQANAVKLSTELAGAKQEIERLKGRVVELTLPPPPPRPTLAELRQRLEARGDTKSICECAFVDGSSGHWYLISLQPSGRSLEFQKRKFKNSDVEQQLRASIRQLNEDVLGPLLQSPVTSKLFVRGEADLLSVVNPTDIQEMPVHRKSDGQRYARESSRSPVEVMIPNNTLPNLRAAWVRDQIAIALAGQTHKHTDIGLLDNPPIEGHKRTVDLILYVKW